jgi:hypothetical protein
MRVLTTLLDHEACPAREIAVLYAERWQIEIAFLHLQRTVCGPRRPLRGQSPELARQEARALLLIHNITATATARAAGPAGLDPGLIPFTAVLGLIRSHVAAEAPCRHCGHRPDSPLASLNTAILALPQPPAGRQRTSGRTTAERRTLAHRRSHLHHRHHKVESPEMGHNSENLRAVAPGLAKRIQQGGQQVPLRHRAGHRALQDPANHAHRLPATDRDLSGNYLGGHRSALLQTG